MGSVGTSKSACVLARTRAARFSSRTACAVTASSAISVGHSSHVPTKASLTTRENRVQQSGRPLDTGRTNAAC